MLSGKKVFVVGGSGYVGGYVARSLTELGAKVYSLSRRGPQQHHPQNSSINWLIGSVMTDCPKYSQQLNQSDLVFHTVGTLIDSSITSRKQPGEPGTYEQMSRDTFLRLLDNVKDPKKIVYLSASMAPPYIPRYLSTKREAEEALLNSKHDGYILRPGFVYSWEHRKWSIPLKYGIDAWNKVHPTISNMLSNRPYLKDVCKQFTVDSPTPLVDIGNTVAYLVGHQYPTRILDNKLMAEISTKFTDQKCGFKN